MTAPTLQKSDDKFLKHRKPVAKLAARNPKSCRRKARLFEGGARLTEPPQRVNQFLQKNFSQQAFSIL